MMNANRPKWLRFLPQPSPILSYTLRDILLVKHIIGFMDDREVKPPVVGVHVYHNGRDTGATTAPLASAGIVNDHIPDVGKRALFNAVNGGLIHGGQQMTQDYNSLYSK
jgi:hypothetical protein